MIPDDADEGFVASPPRTRRLPLGGLQVTDKARELLGVPVYTRVPLLDLPHRPDAKDRTDGRP